MIAGKVWGNTELIEANAALEFHRIEARKGGVCSKHKHELIDETVLTAGMWTKVKPGVYHQFEVVEDCVAFELYWAEFNHNDIVRETVGYAT